MRVIDQAQQRSLLRHLRHQRQHRERDQEPVIRTAGTHRLHADRPTKRRRQMIRNPVKPVQHGSQQLMQTGESELGLGLDTRGRRISMPSARPAASSSSADFPTPGCPRKTSTPLREACAPSSRPAMTALLDLPTAQPHALQRPAPQACRQRPCRGGSAVTTDLNKAARSPSREPHEPPRKDDVPAPTG